MTENKTEQVSGSENWYDTSTGSVIVNETALPTAVIMSELAAQHPEVASIVRWRQGLQGRGGGGVFNRDRFSTPRGLFDQFRVAQDAFENDDVVSGVIESTEAMAFSKMAFSCNDEDQEDVWNQIAEDIDLDSRFREMWQQMMICSQYYMAVWYEPKDFKVRGTSEKGVKRKKEFKQLLVPSGMTLLDPLKVLPIGNFMFNQEKLCYIADRAEAKAFDDVLANDNSSDLMVDTLLLGKYESTREERKLLQAECGDVNLENLYLMNPKNVWRHTMTRPQYARFSTCRMTSVFELLDLKHQLREMDRASLLGGTNFIVLIRIGTDNIPAKAAEVQALAGLAQTAARTPVIVGDHRLSVEFVTPSQDQTLKPERYNTLDARLTARLFMILMSGNYAAGTGGDDSIKLSRVIAAGMESRRHMMRRTFEKNVIKQVMKANEELDEIPSLEFNPKRIALDFDPSVATFFQDLRDRGDISRQTVLSQVDLDEDEEALRREREKEKFDDIFQPTNVPFFKTAGPGADNPSGDSQNPKSGSTNPKAAGRRQGGNQQGGGANPKAGRPPST